MTFRGESFNSPEAEINVSMEHPYKVGETFINPVTELPVQVTFLGNKFYRFFLKGKPGQAHPYEAIEGSEEFANLSNDERFESELVRDNPSVELTWKTDLEDRRIVVSLEQMKSFKKV